MSRGRELRRRLRALGEIREILGSMKSLALMETRKLARFAATQQRVLAGIEQAAADFRRFFSETLAEVRPQQEVRLLLGSERGFCGDFNERLLDALVEHAPPKPLLLAVGARLASKLEGDPRLAGALDGAGVAEESPAVIGRVVTALSEIDRHQGPVGLTVLYHEMDTQSVLARRLLPPLEILPTPTNTYGHPPRLNLPPQKLLPQLVDHYLFAALHAVFYAGLTAENQRRASQLEGAIRRLDETIAGLERQANAARQEEITEEIEIILLNAQSGGDGSRPR